MITVDKHNFVSAEAAARIAFKALDAIQMEDQATQAAGIAMLYVLMCKRFGITPRRSARILEQTEARLVDAVSGTRAGLNNRTPQEYTRALALYFKDELR